jgi:ubiquitin-like 1-activating enzyme E1 A
LLKSFGSELSPVCAIVGGLIGQEIIKILSVKGEPLTNFFIYDGMESIGILEKIG